MKKENIIKIAALIPLAIGLTACGNKKVDANDYLEVEFDGYDTVGTATYYIDFEEMVEDNLAAFDLDEDSSDRAIERVIKKLSKIIEGELEETEGLSNGDKIEFEWDIDTDELEDEFPVKMSFSDTEFEVKKLKKAEKFDPFEYFDITFEGTAPNGTIRIKQNDSNKLGELTIEADKKDKLSNGDKVKLKVATYYGDDLTQYCLKYGMIPEVTEKEIKVKGLKSYVQKLSEITKDTYADIDKKTKEKLDKHVADTWGEDESLVGFTPAGNYLLIPKVHSDYLITHNALCSVYKVDVKSSEGELSYYYYSYVENLMTDDDGKITINYDYIKYPSGGSILGSAYGECFNTESGEHYYVGYKDIDSLYEGVISSKTQNFNVESTVKQPKVTTATTVVTAAAPDTSDSETEATAQPESPSDSAESTSLPNQ